MNDYAIGIDLGGTRVKYGAITPDGNILRQGKFGTVDDSSAQWIEGIRACIQTMENELGPSARLGVAAPGLAARDGRSIAWMMGRMESVMGLDWTQALARGAQIVPVLNDAHAALLGEVWQGAARGAQNAVMLTLGTGVGGAVLCDGRLLRGHIGRAGHLGHISLDPRGQKDIVNTPGSLEDALGECTLPARGGGKYASTEALVAAVCAGDAEAQVIWFDSVRALAAGMVSIANAVDPELFILGGGIAQAGPALLDPLRQFLNDFEWRPLGSGVRVVSAALGDRAGVLGAAWNALQQRAAAVTQGLPAAHRRRCRSI